MVHYFMCKNTYCISMTKVCDMVEDCDDGQDEAHCSYGLYNTAFQIEGNVIMSYKTEYSYASETPREFQCDSGDSIPWSLVNDLVADCPGVMGEDEALTMAILSGNISADSVPCAREGERPCVDGMPACYSMAQQCVYDKRKPACRNFAHLKSCGDALCPFLLKCPLPEGYCIPVRQVCDGDADCPKGVDEEGCDYLTCPGLFQCEEGICIQLSEICDGIRNCRRGEDEILCNWEGFECPINCICSLMRVDCLNGGLPTMHILPASIRVLILSGNIIDIMSIHLYQYIHLTYLDLSNNSIYALPRADESVFIDLNYLVILDLSNNNFNELPSLCFQGLQSLEVLNIQNNKIIVIMERAFMGASILPSLNLSGLHIEHISLGTFSGLSSLRVLDLSKNSIRYLPSSIFAPLISLQELSLKANPIVYISSDLYSGLVDVDILSTDIENICCLTNQLQPCARTGFSNCFKLFTSSLLGSLIWIVAVLSCLGNMVVIVVRLSDSSRSFSTLILNLAFSDILMSFYMFGIATMNIYYSEHFARYELAWIKSDLCTLLGTLSNVSSLMSSYALLLITYHRVLTFVFPFKRIYMKKKEAKFYCFIAWLVSVALSVCPILKLDYFDSANFIKTTSCLYFNLGVPYFAGWEYVFASLVCSCGIIYLLVILGHYFIYKSVSKTTKEVTVRQEGKYRATQTHGKSLHNIALIVSLNFSCWLPSATMFVLSVNCVLS